MQIRIVLAMVIAVPVAACGSQQKLLAPIDSQQAAADDIICIREVPVGTHQYKTRCETRATWEKERDQSREWLNKVVN